MSSSHTLIRIRGVYAGMFPGMVMGNTRGGRRLGQVREVYQNPQYPDLDTFTRIRQIPRNFQVYEVWSGFSSREKTTDGLWYAVDLYLKTPDMSAHLVCV